MFFFIDADTGYVVGGSFFVSRVLLKTTDGGNSWIDQSMNISSPYYDPLTSVQFFNAQTGYISGFNGTVLKTNDGGNSWSGSNFLSQWSADPVTSIFFTDTARGFGTFAGTMVGTKDSGNSWEYQVYSGNNNRFFSVHFSDDVGYAAGNNGIIYKYRDTTFLWQGTNIWPGDEITQRPNSAFSDVSIYPNPFSHSTTLSYKLHGHGLVNVNIYNAFGQLVHQILNEEQIPGLNKCVVNASELNLMDGIYFVELKTNNGKVIKKMIQMK